MASRQQCIYSLFKAWEESINATHLKSRYTRSSVTAYLSPALSQPLPATRLVTDSTEDDSCCCEKRDILPKSIQHFKNSTRQEKESNKYKVLARASIAGALVLIKQRE